jgi:hypothetical protein
MLAAVHVDTNGQVGRLGGDHPVVLDPNPDTVHIKDWVHLIVSIHVRRAWWSAVGTAPVGKG